MLINRKCVRNFLFVGKQAAFLNQTLSTKITLCDENQTSGTHSHYLLPAQINHCTIDLFLKPTG